MKRILKQVGIFVLVFSMMVQSIGMSANATGTTSGNNFHNDATGTTSDNNLRTNRSTEEKAKDSVGTTEIQEGDIDLNDWRQMVLWFEKECNNDFLELAAKDQEWWAGLLPNERTTAEMYAKFITAEDSDPEHYTFETLDEVIQKIESGLAIEEFFDGTRFVYLELSDLYLLKENGYTLDDAAYFMEALYQPELYQSELYDQYAAYKNGELASVSIVNCMCGESGEFKIDLSEHEMELKGFIVRASVSIFEENNNQSLLNKKNKVNV